MFHFFFSITFLSHTRFSLFLCQLLVPVFRLSPLSSPLSISSTALNIFHAREHTHTHIYPHKQTNWHTRENIACMQTSITLQVTSHVAHLASSPISGTASDVGGIVSATSSRNTISDNKIVVPATTSAFTTAHVRAFFSPKPSRPPDLCRPFFCLISSGNKHYNEEKPLILDNILILLQVNWV